jgi:TolB-like protein/Tfp pilus assembly protein PilF
VSIQGGERIAHYELIEKLGEGGMGVVWRALDSRLGRDVAVKVLPEELEADPESLARFEREARAVAALSHPNIVTIYSVEEDRGRHFLTMELVPGVPLSTLIPPGGLPLDRLLQIAIPLASAVGAAHDRGIIHRDLKPANVMVSDGGHVKILDFGLARPRPAASPPDPEATQILSATGEGRVSGTLAYMPPEQVRCAPLDHRSDIFSLGVILYEMACGRRPFQGDTPADLAAAILKDPPPPLANLRAGLPEPLVRVIHRCLEKNVRLRLQSATDLRIGLEDLSRHPGRAARASVPSIAVLPFADMSRERDQGYFCEGLAEEIITALAGVHGMEVASRTSSFRFQGTALDNAEVGRQLDVAALLEGSVRREGGRLRIAVQLIDAAGGRRLWSERFDRDMDDVFAIQDEIARNVVAALEVTLSPGERSAMGKTSTSDVQAYDYYLRGRKFYYQYGQREIEFALQLFSRAIERDAAYARAYAGVADCWSYLFMYADGGPASREQAEAASRRALELDPELAQAHASRGLALSLSQRDPAAESAFETAIRLDPKLFEARYFYARHCFARSQLEKAARLFEEANQVRPEDYQSPLLIAQVYEALGRPAAAEEARRRGMRNVEEHLKLNPEDARALYMGANGLVALGDKQKGLAWLNRALELGPRESMLLYNAGCIRSLAGEIEGAIDCLEQAVDAGLAQRGWFANDSDLESLRSHPRFQALMERLDAQAST